MPPAPSKARYKRFIPAHAGNRKNGPLTHRSAPVHPRARGEQKAHPIPLHPPPGSSPRTRGTASAPRWPPAETRFIPAHAGNSSSADMGRALNTVHPRARGEQCAAAWDAAWAAGSSPRTRGTVPMDGLRPGTSRFIPAHAGNSFNSSASDMGQPVHPRARGEQVSGVTSSNVSGGSSPRTRGTVTDSRRGFPRRRFIPAHAGNSSTPCASAAPCSVHPRARGEQSGACRRGGRVNGSSPRTRGTVQRQPQRGHSHRFIPAHAGNRATAPRTTTTRAVHPRARGEQRLHRWCGPTKNGSSPRTRGTVQAVHTLQVAGRFIPAHAGNRLWHRSQALRGAVHPRARGEQKLVDYAPGGITGSSPRTRGTGN